MAASDALTGADAAAYAGLMQALVTVLGALKGDPE
jgi:hypothetical protein